MKPRRSTWPRWRAQRGSLQELERQFLHTVGDAGEAATVVRISQRELLAEMKKLGIEP